MVHEITAILVSWRDGPETIAAVESLADARSMEEGGPTVSLVVVDNGEGSLDRGELLARWPGATLLVNPTNRGFGPAVNQAAAAASGDVLLILNPDTRAEGDPFSEIARAFASSDAVVAVAPRLIDDPETPGSASRRLAAPDNEDQFTFQLRRLPRLRDDARELLLVDHVSPNNRFRRRYRYADRDPETPLEVEQPAASALAVRTDVFRAIGGFDETLAPAWFEDVDLCARLRERGTILYWPAARFRHRGGAAARELGYARFLRMYYGNAIRYRRRRYRPAARLGYRALLATGMLIRLAALPLRSRPPRPRRESARAYLGALGVALGLAR